MQRNWIIMALCICQLNLQNVDTANWSRRVSDLQVNKIVKQKKFQQICSLLLFHIFFNWLIFWTSFCILNFFTILFWVVHRFPSRSVCRLYILYTSQSIPPDGNLVHKHKIWRGQRKTRYTEGTPELRLQNSRVFFFKISKEIGKACLKSIYGLFCSLPRTEGSGTTQWLKCFASYFIQ